MPTVTNVYVEFYRKIKPADYEGMDTKVALSAIINPDENYFTETAKLMDEAAVLALTPMGRVEDYKKFRGAGMNVQQAVDAAVKGATVDAKPAGEKKGKARSAPPEGAPVTAKAAASDDIPGTAPQIRSNPEDRKNPDDDIPGTTAKPAAKAAAASDIPDAKVPAPKPAKAKTDEEEVKELQDTAAGVVQKGGSLDDIKKVLAGHGVQRISDLKKEDRATVKAKFEALVKKEPAADPLS